MATRMQQRRGTAAQWAVANPVLSDGELGYEKDTGIVKMGNGTSTWNQLSPILGSSYLPVLGKAYDSDRLDGLDSTAFLRSDGKAVDADKLDGLDSTAFLKNVDAQWGYQERLLPTCTSASRPTGVPPYKKYRETDTGDIIAWDPVGNRWAKVGGPPRVIIDQNNGPASGGVTNGGVNIKAERNDTPATVAGLLRIKWTGQWWGAGNAAVIWTLGIESVTIPLYVLPGSGSRGHNHGHDASWFVTFDCEAVYPTSGASVAVFLLGSPDAGGTSVTVAENSCSVWLEAIELA